MRGRVAALAVLAGACPSFDRAAQPNLPPTAAIATLARDLQPQQRVTLDGSASSDPEARPLAFRWSQKAGPFVVLDGLGTGSVAFTAPTGPAELAFELVVVDSRAQESLPAFASFSVADPGTVSNRAPVAAVTAVAFAGAGDVLVLDGSPSSDPDGDTLTYRWRGVSSASLQFLPNASSASPSIVVPVDVGAPLTVGLTVSDGRVSSAEALLTFDIIPGDATHLFVDSRGTCGSGCDGTRRKPFAGITQAASVAVALPTPRPVLVAAGTYGAAVVGGAIELIGGCAPPRWVCGADAGTSTIAASSADVDALKVTNKGLTPTKLSRFTVVSSPGGSLPDSPSETYDPDSVGVRCDDCRLDATLLDVRADGSHAQTRSTFGLIIANTPGPVKVTQSTFRSGVALRNRAVLMRDVGDVTFDRVRFESEALIRDPGIPNGECDYAKHSINTLLELQGQTQVTVTRSRFEADASARVWGLFGVVTSSAGLVVLSGNFFHMKGVPNCTGACTTSGLCNAALWSQSSTASVYLVNNTFLASDPLRDAFLTDGRHYPFVYSFAFSSNVGNFYSVNDYYENFSRLVFAHNAGDRIQFTAATLARVPYIVSHPFFADSTDVETLHTGLMPNGQGSVARANPDGGNLAVAGTCLRQPVVFADPHLSDAADAGCIDLGRNHPYAPAFDTDGDARPLGAGYDRGSDEHP